MKDEEVRYFEVKSISRTAEIVTPILVRWLVYKEFSTAKFTNYHETRIINPIRPEFIGVNYQNLCIVPTYQFVDKIFGDKALEVMDLFYNDKRPILTPVEFGAMLTDGHQAYLERCYELYQQNGKGNLTRITVGTNIYDPRTGIVTILPICRYALANPLIVEFDLIQPHFDGASVYESQYNITNTQINVAALGLAPKILTRSIGNYRLLAGGGGNVKFVYPNRRDEFLEGVSESIRSGSEAGNGQGFIQFPMCFGNEF